MKVFLRYILYLIVLVILSALVVNQQVQIQNDLAEDQNITTLPMPVRLRIPSIGVEAVIVQVGVTGEGNMEVPDNATDVGWFNLGPRPGSIGSAVIAGHFDDKRGEAGVFSDLNMLKAGDRLYVEDNKGITTTFLVRESRVYDLGYADGVFDQSDVAQLNLITCDGVWESGKKSYSKRLVIFSDIENLSIDN